MSSAWRRAAAPRRRSARPARRSWARRTSLTRHSSAWRRGRVLRCEGAALACAHGASAAAAGDEKAAAAARKIRACSADASRPDMSVAAPAATPSKVPRTARVLPHVIQHPRGAIGNCAGLARAKLCSSRRRRPPESRLSWSGAVRSPRRPARRRSPRGSQRRRSARPCITRRRPAADPRRRRLGQDARPHAPHRLPGPHRQRARAGEILAITFTNKAAAEMRERVGLLLGHSTRAMWVMTFHSRLRADAARRGPRLGYTRTVHDLRPVRLAAAGQALPGPARRRPQALHAQRGPAPDLRRQEQAALAPRTTRRWSTAASSRRSPRPTSSTRPSSSA